MSQAFYRVDHAGIIIGQVGINVAANSLSAANDLVSLCPKESRFSIYTIVLVFTFTLNLQYINIRRGQVIASIIGTWIFVPW
jgi:nucleobase:cation symporter-1, NCS1 family